MQEEGKGRGFSDWRESDRGDSIGWAAAFFWAGLILLAQTINFSSNFSWWDGWALFFTGGGVITFIGVVIRLFVPKYPGPSIWDVIWGFILLAIGLSSWEGLDLIWALVLFAIGIIILLSAFSKGKNRYGRQYNEKKEEKSSDEEDWWEECWEDWWRSDRLDAVGWAAIFIWGGLVLLAQIMNFASNYIWWDSWGVFLVGTGVIVLLETVIRLIAPGYRKGWWFTLIVGLGLLALGLNTWKGWDWIWVLVLFAIGFIILLGAFSRRR